MQTTDERYAIQLEQDCDKLRDALKRSTEKADSLSLRRIRLEAALHAPLSSAELKLVDKNCDWVAFKHAWNAVMKSRLANLET